MVQNALCDFVLQLPACERVIDLDPELLRRDKLLDDLSYQRRRYIRRLLHGLVKQGPRCDNGRFADNPFYNDTVRKVKKLGGKTHGQLTCDEL